MSTMTWKLAFPLLAVLLAVGFGLDPDGFELVAANDPEVQTALTFAMDEYNKASSDIYLYKVTKVIRVQRKVGYQYTLTVIIARTLCKKGSVPDWCPVFMDPDKAKSYQCKFVVHNNGWLGRWVMVEQRCS
uniref:Cystatin domain-containing protein n=1 Tax=Oryzias latipes TaxID=8090 RepID=A0A3P9IPQ3_ORYLA